MEHITSSILIDAPIEKVFHFHDDTTNLLKITPPGIKVSFETLGEPGLGYEVILKVRQFGLFTMRWHVRVTQYQPPILMTDIQIKGPFRSWRQIRSLREVNGRTELTDIVDYETPFGFLGQIANMLFIRRQITSMFAYRQAATKRILEA
ncbi:MAG: SRPBCC family protein [Ignavibacteria bacterium]|nr:SRPBCC family protein [Ignavibacteria bacterium]MBP6509242.1 SRPBCC family protein [Candidatus Kapabacteria bacterium]MBK6760903.1 SRPBCC family protein [Ignavibacteria bacterium]MBK7031913.1 SRPBCC family protein [Ignavibacteria bacterium]MBK7185487.1 SRPBCC family protein [Ignavibacteria bacterium]